MFHPGQLNDVKGICEVFRARGIHILVDITQHVGVAPIDLSAWNVSAAAFGCHKGLGCPSGLGALYINPSVLSELKTVPPLLGAGGISNLPASLLVDQDVHVYQSVQRYGHLNLSLVSAVALDASLEFLVEEVGMERVERHLRSLGRELALQLEPLNVEIVGSSSASQRAPHLYVLRLLHPGWQAHLKEGGIYVSHYRCGVRVSFGFYNNVGDIEVLVGSIRRGQERGIPLV